jgi:hypothetical protein
MSEQADSKASFQPLLSLPGPDFVFPRLPCSSCRIWRPTPSWRIYTSQQSYQPFRPATNRRLVCALYRLDGYGGAVSVQIERGADAWTMRFSGSTGRHGSTGDPRRACASRNRPSRWTLSGRRHSGRSPIDSGGGAHVAGRVWFKRSFREADRPVRNTRNGQTVSSGQLVAV